MEDGTPAASINVIRTKLQIMVKDGIDNTNLPWPKKSKMELAVGLLQDFVAKPTVV